MFRNIIKTWNFFLLLLIINFFSACNHNTENPIVFEKEPAIKEDATKVWLRKNENYVNSKNYFLVFNNYYNDKITKKNYVGAAKILDFVSTKLAFYYDFNEPFLGTIKTFDSLYRKKLPALKTTFVDSYYADYYYDKGNFKKACEYYNKITVLEPNDYKSCVKIARANYSLSYTYYGMGKQNLSLLANNKAFKYSSKINDIEGLGAVYSNYTNIYRAIKNKKKAIEYSNKAIKCFVKTGNKYDTYMALYNKICTYEDFSHPRTSQLIDSVMIAFDKSKYKSDVLKIAFSDWKVLYLLQEYKFEEAKKMLDDLKPIVKKVNSENWTQDYDATVAEYEAISNSKDANLNSIETAIPSLKENKQYEKLSLFYNVLKKYAIKKNNFKDALFYEQEIGKVSDSMGNIAMQDKIIELETKYQTQKKQQQIVLQKKTIQNNNYTIALLIAGLIAVLVSVFALSLKRKQQILKLEKQSTQQYTKQLLEKTEEERKRIASDLHDSVSHELLSLKNLFQEKTEITNNKIDAIINDIRIISRNLHPIMFDKIGLKESIIQMVERTQLVNNFMVSADIEYQTDLLSSTELQIYRIIQEALTNIIKYANAHAAKITILEEKSSLFIEVKDNGKGFNVAEKLSGTQAFGLHNIIERSRAIGGESKIISDENGTIISITIPL